MNGLKPIGIYTHYTEYRPYIGYSVSGYTLIHTDGSTVLEWEQHCKDKRELYIWGYYTKNTLKGILKPAMIKLALYTELASLLLGVNDV